MMGDLFGMLAHHRGTCPWPLLGVPHGLPPETVPRRGSHHAPEAQQDGSHLAPRLAAHLPTLVPRKRPGAAGGPTARMGFDPLRRAAPPTVRGPPQTVGHRP